VRIDKGGEVLAPGDPDGQVQFVDVRDLADFMLRCIENDITGVKNVTGFAGRVSMGDLLSACKCATSKPVTLTWVSEEFMTANEVKPWSQMPLFLPRDNRSIVDIQRAIAAGITFRPIADTVRDTLQWAKAERGDKPFARNGLPAEREKELLEKWHARAKSGADQPAVR
jgi:2'-hydroxyisoflavone reductase